MNNNIKLISENAKLILDVAKKSTSVTSTCKNLGYGNSSWAIQKIKQILLANKFEKSSFLPPVGSSRLANKEKLIKVVKESKTLSEVLLKFDMTVYGKNTTTLKDYIKKYNINTEHFDRAQREVNRLRTLEEALPLFEKNSSINRNVIRSYVMRYKLISYVCAGEDCGNTGIWKGKELTLQLEHKNGIGNDHRLENLEFLCPNCHCTTATWGSKSKKKEKKIKTTRIVLLLKQNKETVLNELHKFNTYKQVIKFMKTSHKKDSYIKIKEFMNENKEDSRVTNFLNSLSQTKTVNLNAQEVLNLVLTQNMSVVGQKLGLSSNGVAKFLKRNNLPYKLKELNNIRKEKGIPKMGSEPVNYKPHNKIEWPEGKAWCYSCKSFKLLKEFAPRKARVRSIACTDCEGNSRAKYPKYTDKTQNKK